MTKIEELAEVLFDYRPLDNGAKHLAEQIATCSPDSPLGKALEGVGLVRYHVIRDYMKEITRGDYRYPISIIVQALIDNGWTRLKEDERVVKREDLKATRYLVCQKPSGECPPCEEQYGEKTPCEARARLIKALKEE